MTEVRPIKRHPSLGGPPVWDFSKCTDLGHLLNLQKAIRKLRFEQ